MWHFAGPTNRDYPKGERFHQDGRIAGHEREENAVATDQVAEREPGDEDQRQDVATEPPHHSLGGASLMEGGW